MSYPLGLPSTYNSSFGPHTGGHVERILNVTFSELLLINTTSYGKVYKALDRATGRAIAIKAVTCDSDAESPNRYISLDGTVAKDFTILQSINHPHVLEVLSVYRGAPGPTTYIILEFMAGGTLLDYLLDESKHPGYLAPGSDSPGLPEIACRDIMYQLCQAMAHIHRLGIVHCNLKPENILLTGDMIPFIKIAGFGLAVNIQSERLKQTRGSFGYTAPEVVCPPPSGFDHRADSWSAGILLFAMLILESPYICEPDTHPNALRWDALHARLSYEGNDLLRKLLTEDFTARCSLGEALTHDWLMYHRPMYPNIVYPE
ncbi:kinase-like domain-containing protein [Mycena epipterygia]|nr:kinase-like domain-containing protein [Mycena epipterygia]